MDPTDQEYVKQCRNGHPDDFRFLVQRYERPLFAYLARRLRDHSQAEEAAQESFVRAFFALAKLNKPESFHSWLIGIAARVVHEFQRTAKRRAETSASTEAVAVESSGEREEYVLDEAIAALPESQREVILLRYYEGLSCQQVADRLKTPVGTVTKNLSRAYAGLRQRVQSQPPPERSSEHELR
jgi:RNA polymerase sigma-70 factor (ECF subfamily)